MGFYGNITNVNKSTFQFDKIYPNRTEMDDLCAADGVFIGRYVLVDYNEDSIIGYVHAQITEDSLKNSPVVVGYQEKRQMIVDGEKSDWEILEDRFYSGIPTVTEDKRAIEDDLLYVIKKDSNDPNGNILKDTLLLCLGYIKTVCRITTTDPQTISWEIDGIENENYNPQIFLAAEGETGTEEGQKFVWLKDVDSIWDYNKGRFVLNHQIDAQRYGKNIGRGWDSTVWQKTYRNNQVEYVMIAELNSVVPTFDIVVDAPTVDKPMKPYFDTDALVDVYYKLHLQPSWGFKVQDENIYWFKEGFNKYRENNPITDKDNITLTPGMSGESYYDKVHRDYRLANDRYELSMMLPSIGTSISNMWDIIYGKGTYKDTLGNTLWDKSTFDINSTDSFAYNDGVNDNKIRNTNLEWNTRNGLRAYWGIGTEEEIPIPTYDKTALNTLAGTINTTHDLMGMIIIEKDNLSLEDAAAADPSNIYYDKTTNKFYRKAKRYIFDEDTGILGSNIFNPKDNSHYLLKAYPYDNYDNVYYNGDKASDTPQYEQVINNYYIVGENDTIREDEVYCTKGEETLHTFDPKNFDPSKEEESDYLWYHFDDNDMRGYKHETDLVPKNTVYYTITATEVTSKPLFYEPGEFYLMKKYDLKTPEAMNEWNNKSPRDADIDFDYLNTMQEASLAEALRNNDIDLEDENRTIGYKILKDVTVDTSLSKFVLVDINRRIDEESPADNSNIIQQDDALYYTWLNYSAALQNKRTVTRTIEISEGNYENIEYLIYDITVYRSKSRPGLGSKTLQEWQTYVEENPPLTAEDFMNDLVQDIRLVKKVTDPYYVLTEAEDIKDKLHDKNGVYVNYYFKYPPTDENPLRYVQISNPNSIEAKNNPWYELVAEKIDIYYDLSGEYYNKVNGNFLRETMSVHPVTSNDEKPSRYTAEFYPEKKRVFIPGIYYDKVDNKWIDEFSELQEDRKYYRDINKYIINDPNGVYEKGTCLNSNIELDDSITTWMRDFEWTFEEIPHFAEDMNTMHGLILGINQMLLNGDTLTRDRATVQGSINTLNDIINRFSDLLPGEIVMVDNYGRVHSTGHTEDNWISLERTGRPSLTLSHKFTPVSDTTTSSDINDNGDTIELYTPIVDEKGHVVGKNTETVTLPYGFKTITGNNGELVADNTQDTVALSGDNWIQATASADGVAFAHIGPVAVAERSVAPVTPNFGDTFTIEDWRFDEKGHKAGLQTHTVTIPKGSLSVSEGIDNAKVITSLAFTDTTGELRATNKNIGDLNLVGYDLPTNPTVAQAGILGAPISATDPLNQAIEKLEYQLHTDIAALDADLDATGAAQNNGVFVMSGVTEVDGKLTAVDSVEVDPAGAAAAALANAIGEAGDASTANTIYGAKAYAENYVNTFESTYTPEEGEPTTITLTGLAEYIAGLQAQIAALEARVAALEPEPTPTTYSVTYSYSGSTPEGATPPVDSNAYADSDEVTIQMPETVEGWTFNGWTIGNEPIIEPLVINGSDIELVGTWTQSE